MYTYHVVPFEGQARGTLDAKALAAVSQQLQEAINAQIKAGWEYVETTSVTIRVAPGCLGRFLGASADHVTFDQIIFRKPV